MGIDGALDWTVRPASHADAEALALIACTTFLEAYAGLVPVADMLSYCASENSAAAFERMIAAGARVWIAEAAVTYAPLGYAMLVPSSFEDSGVGDIELKRIYVLQRCQGTALARSLLDTVVDAAAGHSRLLLGVNRDNLRAQGFYRKHGFDLAGTRTFVVAGAHYDDFIYAKPLDSTGTP